MGEGHDSSGLAEYLSTRDIACPDCGYNLRSMTGGTCPECGTHLSLHVTSHDATRDWRRFLLLVFGWIAVASALIAVEEGVGAYQIAALPRRIPGLSFLGGSTGPASPAGTASVQMATTTFASGVAAPKIPPPLAWSGVATSQWLGLGLATLLALSAVFGFVITSRSYRSGTLAHRVRRLGWFVGVLGTIWGGWYIVNGLRFIL